MVLQGSLFLLGDERTGLRRARVIGLFIGRESSLAHIAAILRGGAGDHGAHIGVAPREFRLVAEREAHKIVDHENLAVAVRPRADADGRDAQFSRDARGQFARNRFENDRECAGRFHGARVGEAARPLPRFSPARGIRQRRSPIAVSGRYAP